MCKKNCKKIIKTNCTIFYRKEKVIIQLFEYQPRNYLKSVITLVNPEHVEALTTFGNPRKLEMNVDYINLIYTGA